MLFQPACGTSQREFHLCHVPQLFPVLIGRQGATKRRVEDDTGAGISIPGRGAQVRQAYSILPSTS